MEEKNGHADKTATQVKMEDNILNSLNISIYVSDMATNKLLYANMALQQKHGGQPLIGKVCWEALESKTKRCESCPIPYLLKHPGENYQREIYNGGHLKIHDSIIQWGNGKLVHLRYMIDIAKEYSIQRE